MKIKDVFTKELINKINFGFVKLNLRVNREYYDILSVSCDKDELICDWDEGGWDEGFVFNLNSDITTDVSNISGFLVVDVEDKKCLFDFYTETPYPVISSLQR